MSRIEVCTFDGNIEALRKMAYASWAAEYPRSSWPDLYAPALVREYFETLPDPRFLVGAYKDGEIVGFLANLPRTYRFQGRRYQGVISCMLAINHSLPGVLGPLLAECMQRNALFGADFSLFTLEANHKAIRLFRAIKQPGSAAEAQTARLLTMRPLVHAVDFAAIRAHEALGKFETTVIQLLGAHRPIESPVGASSGCRPAQLNDLEGVLRLLNQASDEETLVRIFEPESLRRRWRSPEIGGIVVHEQDGQINGLLSFSTYNMVNERGARPWAWVDLVYWQGLSSIEKQSLLGAAWELCQERGCIGMMQWTKQKQSALPFYQARFIPYPRALDIQAWYLKPGALQNVRGLLEQMI